MEQKMQGTKKTLMKQYFNHEATKIISYLQRDYSENKKNTPCILKIKKTENN